MSNLLPFIVIGITVGSVYGLSGVGLVLTYKTSGIFNFGFGALAAVSVFIFYFLYVTMSMPWPWAVLICLAVVAPLEGLLLERMARSLANASATVKIVATVGLILIVVGIGNIWYGGQSATFPSFLNTDTFEVASIFIGYDQLAVILIALLATIALFVFFRRARLGVAMRGVVDNPELLAMTGESPARVRRVAWIIGSIFASMGGLLLAPNLNLSAIVLTEIVIQSFGAAAIGYFSNLPLTYVGGLLVGIAGALASNYTTSVPWLSGLPIGLPFIILFVVLIVTPKYLLLERKVGRPRAIRPSWYAPTRARLVIGGLFVVLLVAVPAFAGARLSIWSTFLIFAVVFLSLGLLVRTSGQVSLCHAAFMAVGAAGMAHFAGDGGVPWLLALFLAGLVAVPVGALLSIPAIRLSGVYLALATFGFGVLMDKLIYTQDFMFGHQVGGIAVPRPSLSIGPIDFASDRGFYYVLLLLAILTVVLVFTIQRTRLGRLLRGLGDSPLALETQGTTPNVTRVIVFCISAFVAAIAGALYSSLFHFAAGSQFSYLLSLQLIALLVITVVGEPWYAVVCAGAFILIPGYLQIQGIDNYLTILFGVFAATFAMTMENTPQVPAFWRRFLDKAGGRPTVAESEVLQAQDADVRAADREERARVASLEPAPAPAQRGDVTSGLEVRGLSVRFGGVQAVRELSLIAPGNRITGLIGPNGAGKTTTFNACCGQVKPTQGQILLHGSNVSRTGPAGRARRGLGRTFQRVELFDSLTVRENVRLGREATMAGANPITQVFSGPKDSGQLDAAAESAMELVGISRLADIQAGLLPTGQRRLVELARTLAGPFDMLLLDEPSSGLNHDETGLFGEILLEVVRERGAGILLVEHDMALVRAVCEQIYVLDFGELIFTGSAEEMLVSDVVRDAYLGSEAVVAAAPQGGQDDA